MAYPSIFIVALTIILLAIPLATARLLSILPPRRRRLHRKPRSSRNNDNTPTHILIILGSGGHTAEMLSILRRSYGSPDATTTWPTTFQKRTWVVSTGDTFSASFARSFESSVGGVELSPPGTPDVSVKDGEVGNGYTVVEVPRARKIHQPLYTAPLSCWKCFVACLRLLTRDTYPDIVICNGPATAAICVFATVFLRFVGWKGANKEDKMRTVYVESWARVKKLSLSGRLLAGIVDRLLVQWEGLEGVAGRGEFRGVLVG